MRILANENVPGDAVKALRARRHDVTWIREASPGAADDAVLQLALEESRVLLTFDKDFGELVFRSAVAGRVGVILCRFVMAAPDVVAERIVAVLEARDDWPGMFSVIEDDRIRMTPMPSRLK